MKLLNWIPLAALIILLPLALLPPSVTAGPGAARNLQSAGDAWLVDGEQSGSRLGQVVVPAGDVNGDGYRDLLVSDKSFNGSLYDGRALAYYGSPAGLSTTPDWVATTDQPGSLFGRILSPAGDVNGDGYDDVLVAAPYYDAVDNDEGRAFLYYGSANGLGATPGWTADGEQYGSYFSRGLGAAGDVNGDGYDDVIVGATYWLDPNSGEWGRVSLFLGSSSGLGDSAVWTAQGNTSNGNFGAPLEGAGDVNADGYDDFLIAEPYFWGDQDQEGKVYLYLGSPSGPADQPAWTAEGDQNTAYFGNAIDAAGDVNGDGYGDVVVAAWYFNNGESNEGRAYVYQGSAGGLSADPAWSAEGNQSFARFGVDVAGVGDANGDGFDDVLVGADGIINPQLREGRGYLFAGSGGGLSATPLLTVEGDQDSAYFASAVAGPGDVDGNGVPDLAFGAALFDWDASDDGIVLVMEADQSSPLPTPGPVTPTPTFAPPTPTPTPEGSMHVADLESSASQSGGAWTASATVSIVTSSGEPLSGVQVRGIWTRNGTGIGVGACTTDGSGACVISHEGIRNRTKTVTFQVDTVSHATFVYNPAANTDADGDSDGNTITVNR